MLSHLGLSWVHRQSTGEDLSSAPWQSWLFASDHLKAQKYKTPFEFVDQASRLLLEPQSPWLLPGFWVPFRVVSELQRFDFRSCRRMTAPSSAPEKSSLHHSHATFVRLSNQALNQLYPGVFLMDQSSGSSPGQSSNWRL